MSHNGLFYQFSRLFHTFFNKFTLSIIYQLKCSKQIFQFFIIIVSIFFCHSYLSNGNTFLRKFFQSSWVNWILNDRGLFSFYYWSRILFRKLWMFPMATLQGYIFNTIWFICRSGRNILQCAWIISSRLIYIINVFVYMYN